MMRCNTWAKWDHMDEIWSLRGCNLMTLLKLCHQLDYVVELDGMNEISHEDEIKIYVDGIGPYNWTSFTWMHVTWNLWHPWTQFFFSMNERKKEHKMHSTIWMKHENNNETMFVGDGKILEFITSITLIACISVMDDNFGQFHPWAHFHWGCSFDFVPSMWAHFPTIIMV